MPGRLACVVVAALLALPAAPALAARQKPIRGKLSLRGYTVIALATNGKVSTARVRTGAFSLRPPAGRVSLHLRDRGGVYAGPIVLARRGGGKRAVVGARAGARLGRISVLPEKGYARVARRPRRRAIDRSRVARARKGVPIGAGVFGWVRSKPPRRPPRGDRDFDGVPDRLDIDDDGDLVLDKVDRSRLARARAAAVTSEDPLGLATGLGVRLAQTPNVHAGASDVAIDQASRDLGYILMNIPFAVAAVELDCGARVPAGLSYCAPGGTARLDSGRAFPDCCDSDGDGFGTMDPTDVVPGDYQNFVFDHRSSSTQIRTGDVLIHHVTRSGSESQCPPPGGSNPNCVSYSSLQQLAFATVPALKSFSDGQAPTVTIPYPVGDTAPGASPSNPFPISARSGGDVVLRVTLWRPQRRPTSAAECRQPPEPNCAQTEWIDMGGLVHYATAGPSDRHYAAFCPQNAFSNPDSKLTPFSPDPGAGGLLDRAGAGPADPANTLAYSLNLTRCLAAEGISFNVGQTRAIALQTSTPPGVGGVTGVDNAHQIIFVRRTG